MPSRSTLGELFILLGVDPREFEEGMRRAERQAQQSSKQIVRYMQDAADSMRSIGQAMSLAITLPLTFIGKSMIQMAMGAVESENLFEVSMGNMAKAAREWSNELSKTLGLNQYELRRNVGMFNAMLTSMGFNEKAAYGMARGLTQLAYDMASFYNLKPEEAFIKLKSGITGEAEPLKELGILVMEQQTKEAAYRHGVAKTGAALTEQQKVLGRYYAIMEQTAKAQGDLARTIDSPANKARVAKSRYDELSVTLGTKLLPLFERIVTVLDKAVAWLQRLPDGTQTAIVASLLLAWALGPLLMGLAAIVTLTPQFIAGLRAFMALRGVTAVVNGLAAAFRALNVAMLRNPIILGIVAIAGALLLLARSSKTVSDWLDNVITRLRALAGLDTQPAQANVTDPDSISQAAMSYEEYAKALAGAGDAAQGAGKEFKKFLAAFDEVYQIGEEAKDQTGNGLTLPGMPGNGGPGDQGGPGVPVGGGVNVPDVPQYIPPIIWGGIQPPPGAVAEELETALERIRNALLQPLPAVALPNLVPVPDPVPVWVTVQQGIVAVLEALKTSITAAALAAGTSLAAAWVAVGVTIQGVYAALQTAWSNLVSVWQTSLSTVQGILQAISEVWGTALDKVRQVIDGFREWAQEVWNRLGESLRTTWETALAFIQNLWENHKGVVIGIIIALIAGVVTVVAGGPAAIAGALAPLVPAIAGLLSRIPGLFSNVFGRIPGIVSGILSGIMSTVSSWASRIGSIISNVLSGARTTLSGRYSSRSVTIPAYASGGIAWEPQIAAVAEEEPEAIIPLSKLGQFGGGGGQNVTLQIGVLVADEWGLRELERRLRSIRIGEAARTGAEMV